MNVPGLGKLLRPGTYRDWLLVRVARLLRPYLARTPLIWGDKKRVTIGANVALVDVIINCRSGSVVIEDNAFFGHGVMLLTGTHDMTKAESARHELVPDSGRDIHVGRGAWIASNCIVIGPCSIGENAVVGAGSVVSGTVEAKALYRGNPAKFVRRIDMT